MVETRIGFKKHWLPGYGVTVHLSNRRDMFAGVGIW